MLRIAPVPLKALTAPYKKPGYCSIERVHLNFFMPFEVCESENPLVVRVDDTCVLCAERWCAAAWVALARSIRHRNVLLGERLPRVHEKNKMYRNNHHFDTIILLIIEKWKYVYHCCRALYVHAAAARGPAAPRGEQIHSWTLHSNYQAKSTYSQPEDIVLVKLHEN